MRYVMILAATLAGCATVIPVEQASNTDVCRNLTMPEYAPTARQEAARRGLDCEPYFRQRQAESNALSNAAQYFNRPAPPLPVQRQCRTIYRGNGIYDTVCD